MRKRIVACVLLPRSNFAQILFNSATTSSPLSFNLRKSRKSQVPLKKPSTHFGRKNAKLMQSLLEPYSGPCVQTNVTLGETAMSYAVALRQPKLRENRKAPEFFTD